MEMLLGILDRLEINSSVFTQTIVVFVLFFIAKYLFYGKLQDILETRAAKTTGLESQADKQFERVEALKEEYENKISGARLKAQKEFNQAKKEISEKLDKKLADRSEIIEKRIEEARVKIAGEVQAQKEELLGESENLAGELVNKILQ